MSEPVLILIEGKVGRIRLNRPQALHALTEPMCRAMIDALVAWRGDPAVELVLIDHAEGRGFCAGGDVRAVAESAAGDGVAARAFFRAEYQLNHLLFTFAKPVVAVMDGVVMGGGVGLALPARYRIATGRTLFAMPEATIGLFPDVGGGWYLSRLPGRIGAYLALTAARLDGAEVTALGLATHHVAAEAVERVKADLIARPREAQAVLDAAAADPGGAAILSHRDAIDRLFASEELEGVVAALEADGDDWARETLATLRAKSPQSGKIALRLLRQGATHTDFADEMRVEYGVMCHVSMRHDFVEGVRALLIDRDNAPRWNPATPEDVTDNMLDTIFAPLPADEAWEPVRA
ncbi:enoyl-CoA hydratase/isomerase family protein [uncultured Sphingomonas sp.]|mgnify:CR=1 FL=1|uniref:enoyl-CoA hydratase/isomerase family protein n=1 Tax=uncultured Sphingomonas sp. TaxID=158754 RepID=UPI0025F4F82A|nr:enoyl-CoA hydratase/isomerase family protein [uncultured Sphingomonas sp.]